jgi:hypothetical protein
MNPIKATIKITVGASNTGKERAEVLHSKRSKIKSTQRVVNSVNPMTKILIINSSLLYPPKKRRELTIMNNVITPFTGLAERPVVA